MKANQSTKLERIKFVQELLLVGHTRSEIISQCVAKFALKTRQVDQYIQTATNIIKEVNQVTLQDNLALISSNLWAAFRLAKITNNVGEMRQVLMALAKLKGLDQHAINLIIEDKRELVDLADSDLDTILAGTNEYGAH